jgi:hypothetical protein
MLLANSFIHEHFKTTETGCSDGMQLMNSRINCKRFISEYRLSSYFPGMMMTKYWPAGFMTMLFLLLWDLLVRRGNLFA